MSIHMIGNTKVNEILADPQQNIELQALRDTVEHNFTDSGFQTVDIPLSGNPELDEAIKQVFGTKLVFVGISNGKRILLGTTGVTLAQFKVSGVIAERFADFIDTFNSLHHLLTDCQILMLGDYSSFTIGASSVSGNVIKDAGTIARLPNCFYTLAYAGDAGTFLRVIGGTLDKLSGDKLSSGYKIKIIGKNEYINIAETVKILAKKFGVTLATENKGSGD